MWYFENKQPETIVRKEPAVTKNYGGQVQTNQVSGRGVTSPSVTLATQGINVAIEKAFADVDKK